MPNTDEYIGVVISDVARLLRTEFDRRVRRLGITRAQWLVLTRLHRRPGASHSELAEMMEVEKATAGRMIDRLVANGWVERRTQADDRRVKRVYLTARSRAGAQAHLARGRRDGQRRARRSLCAGEPAADELAAAHQENPGVGGRCGERRCAVGAPRRSGLTPRTAG